MLAVSKPAALTPIQIGVSVKGKRQFPFHHALMLPLNFIIIYQFTFDYPSPEGVSHGDGVEEHRGRSGLSQASSQHHGFAVVSKDRRQDQRNHQSRRQRRPGRSPAQRWD